MVTGFGGDQRKYQIGGSDNKVEDRNLFFLLQRA